MFSLFELENGWMGRSIVPFELVDDLEARFMESISRDNRVESRGWKSNGQSSGSNQCSRLIYTPLHTVPRRCWSIFKHDYLALNFASMRLLVFLRRCYLFKGNSPRESGRYILPPFLPIR